MNTPKFGRVNKTRIIMNIMIIIVIILLAVVGVLLVINWKNKNKNDNKVTPTAAPTQGVVMVTATPEPSINVKPTSDTPTPTVGIKATATPTATPIPDPGALIVGLDSVPANIRSTVESYAKDVAKDVTVWGGNIAKNPKINIEAYYYPAFTSVLMTCTADGTSETHKEAYTFDAKTGTKLAANEVFRETYLAIIKERLQTYAVEKDPVFLRTSFIKYDEAYNATDYNKFYIHDNKVTFIFGNGTLTEILHKEFTYDADLSEATAFMYNDVNGLEVGYQIRKDLDPTRPMIALTYDDGPYDKVETKLLEIFDKYDAKCTFFAVGERIDSYKGSRESLLNVVNAGHEIGSHTYSHQSFKTEDCDKKLFWTEINKNNLTIAKNIGYAPVLIRMPGGNNKLDYMAKHLPMPMINWYLDTRDWDKGIIYPEKSTEAEYNAKVDSISKKVIDEVGDGQIVLMHSLYQTTAEATNEIMATLSIQGYQFVTVSELFYYKGITLENGKVSYSTTTKNNYNRDYSKN